MLSDSASEMCVGVTSIHDNRPDGVVLERRAASVLSVVHVSRVVIVGDGLLF